MPTATATRNVLPPVAIPTKLTAFTPAEAMARYPTSSPPIHHPPSLPRGPLRDRCGVTLTLRLDSSSFNGGAKGACTPKNTQPHRTHLPRLPRRNRPGHAPWYGTLRDTPVVEAAPAAVTSPHPPTPAAVTSAHATPSSPTDALFPRTPEPRAPHLQEIIPSVWVAFDSAAAPGFTHVVEIYYATPGTRARPVETVRGAHGARVRLALPAESRTWAARTGRAGLALSDAQLRAARDFMGECLPPAAAAGGAGAAGIGEGAGAVRILVSVPAGRPTDAMCAVGCYLAFVAGRPVDEVLQCVDDEESVLSVWKGEVCGDEMERVERVARAWSWLSTTAVPAAPQ